jgi:SAM-dependent methyltransferase
MAGLIPASTTSSTPTTDVPAVLVKSLQLVGKLGLSVGRNAVDLGCGNGRNTLYLAKQGFQVTAVDYVAHAINQLLVDARTHKVANSINVVRAPLDKPLPFTENNFDLAIDLTSSSSMSLSQLESYELEVRRTLRPQGLLVVYRMADIGDAMFEDLESNEIQPAVLTEEKLRAIYNQWEFLNLDITVKIENYFGQEYTKRWWWGILRNQKGL